MGEHVHCFLLQNCITMLFRKTKKLTADILRILRRVLTVVYEVGVFDFASSCLMLEYAVAIYSSSSLGIDGDNFLAAEMYALSTTNRKFQVKKCF